ncbi:MAG: NADP oxidoreductase [Gammaproteobacteria bacterium]|nr:NADP oxidoreductase [Gammaproteobacteria bacterium]
MSTLGSAQNPLCVAIVGSGPSGFYSTEALIRSELTVKVDMFERLPSPYGLVRSGVAPDHQKLKQAIQVYAKIAEQPEFNFIGNVTVGRDISIAVLCTTHHAVILTYGAETNRRLGISGDDLPGSHTATEFVGWYNGHPDYRDRIFDLSHETAVIIGQGNVAADVSRILAKNVDELKHTDITEHALAVLAESNIKNIYIIGRRGPAQAKFASKEIKEFGELAICDPLVDPDELLLNPESENELRDKSNSGSKKNYDILSKYSSLPTSNKQRQCHFTFLKSPIKIIGDGRVEKIILEKNKLTGDPMRQSARGTGRTIELETGIVFSSIGYRGLSMPGVPFNDDRGVLPNSDGRIVDADNKPLPQLYCAGWIKRGPTGIIGTNRADSVATVAALLEDVKNMDADEHKSGAEGAYQILDNKGIRHISFSEWKKIDQKELARGLPKDKLREKFTYIKEMLALLD